MSDIKAALPLAVSDGDAARSARTVSLSHSLILPNPESRSNSSAPAPESAAHITDRITAAAYAFKQIGAGVKCGVPAS